MSVTCMEMDCKVVLPNCRHSMCIGCFDEWHVHSRSCPFCRGSLKRVTSDDLWVLSSRRYGDVEQNLSIETMDQTE